MDREAREIMKQRLQIMMRAGLQSASIYFFCGYHFYGIYYILCVTNNNVTILRKRDDICIVPLFVIGGKKREQDTYFAVKYSEIPMVYHNICIKSLQIFIRIGLKILLCKSSTKMDKDSKNGI